MQFNSFTYILVFLPIVLIGCIALRKFFGPTAAQAWILLASLVFYAKGKPSDLIYLILSVVVNWLLARAIQRTQPPAKKRILVWGLILNIGYLCLFKYVGFFASLASPVLPRGFHAPQMAFPLGVSFFTVTQIMYLVDCYESILPAGSLFDHASFVAFFPYLISGPLGRAKRMRHQFGNFGGPAAGQQGGLAANLSRGIFHFSIGLFKKAVFASAFSQVATWGNSVAHPSAIEQWVFSVSYMMELYFDFSGYTDMAIGSAMMLGIEIPRNFDAPYSATSIIDFWQRWHISLTSFITGYLYTPILRAFKKYPAMGRNMLFTSGLATFFAMGIAGLWHGAAMTFVVYGFLHGTYLAINQYWRKKKLPNIPAFPGWVLTFVAVDIADTYFSASSLRAGTQHTLALFNPSHALSLVNLKALTVNNFPIQNSALLLVAAALLAILGASSEQRARDFRPTWFNCAGTVALLLVGFLFTNSSIPVPFIYFKF
jgi:D-alanyl-lipoteichoic acid acyltransferase DltB (MBOAT superfamily)